MNGFIVAVDAGVLCHQSVSRFNLDRIEVVLSRKGDGMKQAIIRLGYPLSNEIVR